jgi:hypothetical protein
MNHHGAALSTLTPAFVPYETVAETSFKSHPDRFIRMTSGLTERTKGAAEVSPAETAQFYKEQFDAGVKGIGETNFMLGVRGNYTAKDLRPIVDLVVERDAPVLLHTGWRVAAGAPINTARLLGAGLKTWPHYSLPTLKSSFVLGHTGGVIETPDAREAVRLGYSFLRQYVLRGFQVSSEHNHCGRQGARSRTCAVWMGLERC